MLEGRAGVRSLTSDCREVLQEICYGTAFLDSSLSKPLNNLVDQTASISGEVAGQLSGAVLSDFWGGYYTSVTHLKIVKVQGD